MTATRDRRLNVRLHDHELELLQELAQHLNVSSSDIVRACILRMHEQVFGTFKDLRKRRRRK